MDIYPTSPLRCGLCTKCSSISRQFFVCGHYRCYNLNCCFENSICPTCEHEGQIRSSPNLKNYFQNFEEYNEDDYFVSTCYVNIEDSNILSKNYSNTLTPKSKSTIIDSINLPSSPKLGDNSNLLEQKTNKTDFNEEKYKISLLIPAEEIREESINFRDFSTKLQNSLMEHNTENLDMFDPVLTNKSINLIDFSIEDVDRLSSEHNSTKLHEINHEKFDILGSDIILTKNKTPNWIDFSISEISPNKKQDLTQRIKTADLNITNENYQILIELNTEDVLSSNTSIILPEEKPLKHDIINSTNYQIDGEINSSILMDISEIRHEISETSINCSTNDILSPKKLELESGYRTISPELEIWDNDTADDKNNYIPSDSINAIQIGNNINYNSIPISKNSQETSELQISTNSATLISHQTICKIVEQNETGEKSSSFTNSRNTTIISSTNEQKCSEILVENFKQNKSHNNYNIIENNHLHASSEVVLNTFQNSSVLPNIIGSQDIIINENNLATKPLPSLSEHKGMKAVLNKTFITNPEEITDTNEQRTVNTNFNSSGNKNLEYFKLILVDFEDINNDIINKQMIKSQPTVSAEVEPTNINFNLEKRCISTVNINEEAVEQNSKLTNDQVINIDLDPRNAKETTKLEEIPNDILQISNLIITPSLNSTTSNEEKSVIEVKTLENINSLIKVEEFNNFSADKSFTLDGIEDKTIESTTKANQQTVLKDIISVAICEERIAQENCVTISNIRKNEIENKLLVPQLNSIINQQTVLNSETINENKVQENPPVQKNANKSSIDSEKNKIMEPQLTSTVNQLSVSDSHAVQNKVRKGAVDKKPPNFSNYQKQPQSTVVKQKTVQNKTGKNFSKSGDILEKQKTIKSQSSNLKKVISTTVSTMDKKTNSCKIVKKPIHATHAKPVEASKVNKTKTQSNSCQQNKPSSLSYVNKQSTACEAKSTKITSSSENCNKMKETMAISSNGLLSQISTSIIKVINNEISDNIAGPSSKSGTIPKASTSCRPSVKQNKTQCRKPETTSKVNNRNLSPCASSSQKNTCTSTTTEMNTNYLHSNSPCKVRAPPVVGSHANHCRQRAHSGCKCRSQSSSSIRTKPSYSSEFVEYTQSMKHLTSLLRK